MLLLVTGASGVGKSTVRRILQSQLAPEVECVELAEILSPAVDRDLAWRQRATERAVEHAAQLQDEARHLLVCGDPVAAIEAASVPSAPRVGMAFCLLDADPDAQAARLAARGDDPGLLVHHHAFAEWMRKQADNPLHMLDVVATGGWSEMRWDRIVQLAPHWHVHVIDTSELRPPESAAAVRAWISSVLAGTTAVVRVADQL